ncbi:MAG: xanthine dehydrogenase family protein subunit M [Betaproteobacteria bacterium]|nr:xanthine dehydrogenase family protein subunit M [Betaproteobacteria bacterium]
MKAPAFGYVKPRSLDEALEVLERHGEGARVLAGGQSLIPSLNMRLSSPELLVDISSIGSLKGITLDQDVVRIGALVTHAELERSAEIARHVPLLAEAVRHVAHPAIRNRGTLGGSLALADPAAEYPACALALEATIFISGKRGERGVKAAHFFKGLFETDLKPGEIVTAVEVPAQLDGERSVFLELARRQGDYAIVGLAAFRGAETRFAFFNVGPKPVLAKNAALKKSLAEAKEALKADLLVTGDLYTDAATKQHLAGVLLERAWNKLSTSH